MPHKLFWLMIFEWLFKLGMEGSGVFISSNATEYFYLDFNRPIRITRTLKRSSILHGCTTYWISLDSDRTVRIWTEILRYGLGKGRRGQEQIARFRYPIGQQKFIWSCYESPFNLPENAWWMLILISRLRTK